MRRAQPGDLSGREIWTLGPCGTDAEAEGRRLGADVRLVPSFAAAMARACETQSSALVAAGYLAADPGAVGSTWVDLHFGYSTQMHMDDVWESPTKPMALAVRDDRGLADIRSVALHPSTRALLDPVLGPEVIRRTVDAKPLAVALLARGEVDACLGSTDVIEACDGLRVVQEFHPTMVWCLYAATLVSAAVGAPA